MASSFVDFTDLFRNFADIEFVSDNYETQNNIVLEKILSLCANSVFLRKKDVPKYSPSQIKQIKEILEKQPYILKLYGIEIENAKKEIEKYDKMNKNQSI